MPPIPVTAANTATTEPTEQPHAPATPRIGQIVLFHRATGDLRFAGMATANCPAIITDVYPDGRVGLAWFDPHAGGLGVGSDRGPVSQGEAMGEWSPLPASAQHTSP